MATMAAIAMPDERPDSAVPLHHRDFGGEGTPPFVILHGMLGSSRNWQTVGRDLAARRRTFALDLRNHGESPHADVMTYDSMAADVLAWLDARAIEAADFIGHSMGGKVAMVLACRHPERVHRLIVVDIAPKPYAWPAHRVEFAAMKGLDRASLRSRAEAESRLEAAHSRLADAQVPRLEPGANAGRLVLAVQFAGAGRGPSGTGAQSPGDRPTGSPGPPSLS